MNDDIETPRIALALSGGGIRAAVFHLGVIRRLAEAKLLEEIKQISTVSGGSLVTGAIFARAGGRWPGSDEFVSDIYPSIRNTLITQDLFSFRALGFKGFLRENAKILSRRANILSRLLQREWGIDLRISDLPKDPLWHINTTCIETGKNWRFNQECVGDWEFGRNFTMDAAISDAIAASAAVPYVINALALSVPEKGWKQTDPATKEPIRDIVPKHRNVHLWDGGAYENMALEAVYKPDKGLVDCDALICSDASGLLGEPKSIFPTLLKGKLASPRLFDIASDQIRALRSRMLMQSITKGEVNGSLVRIGTHVDAFRRPSAASQGFLSAVDCRACRDYPTTLTRIEEADFDRIARHGSETAYLTVDSYSTNHEFVRARIAATANNDHTEAT